MMWVAAQTDSFHFVVFFEDGFPEPWLFRNPTLATSELSIRLCMKN